MRLQRIITVVGCHAEGEVGRVITGGVLPPPGRTLFEQKCYLETQADDLRQFLLFEPRGGAFVHVNLIVPPTQAGSDAGFIIMEPTDYPPMSGSNAMCVVTVLLETGMLPMVEPFTTLVLETPGGVIEARAECQDGKCKRVTVHNVPSFVAALDVPVDVPGIGQVVVDIAYGGAFFALLEAQPLGFALTPDEARDLVEMGEKIKAAVVAQCPVVHPQNAAIHTVTFTEFTGPVVLNHHGVKSGQNAVVISPGKIDRSPCGTGTSARLAVLHARGVLGVHEPYLSTSLIGSEFQAQIIATTTLAEQPAILPSLSGRAWITGIHQYCLDSSDPFPQGYTLSDTWYRVL